MGYQWGNREQPSSQPPEPTQPNEQDPGQAWLALGVSAFTAVVLLCLLDETIDHDFSRGFYSIGTGMFVVGLVGWVQARGRRHVENHSQMILDRLAALTGQVEELREQVDRHRCPGQPTYLSAVVGSQSDTVPLMPAVAPDAEAALRRISMKLLKGGTDQR